MNILSKIMMKKLYLGSIIIFLVRKWKKHILLRFIHHERFKMEMILNPTKCYGCKKMCLTTDETTELCRSCMGRHPLQDNIKEEEEDQYDNEAL